MIDATLQLFKSYVQDENTKMFKINQEALKYGIVIDELVDENVIKKAIEIYGIDGFMLNQTLHKDFNTVKDSPIEKLLIDQLVHYFSTYGLEQLGIYDNDYIYIPKEELNIPNIEIDKIKLTVIRPISTEALKEKLMTLLTSGIALSKTSIQHIMTLSDFIDKEKFDLIKNREIRTLLYDKYNVVPKNPEEFLRFLLYKTTYETLKIQNKYMVQSINNSDKTLALKLFKSYLKNNEDYKRLSSIFLRNKTIFLAYKVKDNNKELKELNTIINKLRKYAKNHHKPLKNNIADSLTQNIYFEEAVINSVLDNMTIFREIRILNGIIYKLSNNQNILYKIRNGKSFVSKMNVDFALYNILNRNKTIIEQHLIRRLREKVAFKTIYIPSNITYAAPTSEKKFIGNIPQGSVLTLPKNKNIVYGVHWFNIKNDDKQEHIENAYWDYTNTDEERVDLDLKQMNKNEVFGWDANYRDDNRLVLFSGDVTSAPYPNGATEAFFVDKTYKGSNLLMLNMYTPNKSDVPFDFIICEEDDVKITKNHTINPNHILAKIKMNMDKNNREMALGTIKIDDEIQVYFDNFSIGKINHIYSTASNNSYNMDAFEYLKEYNKLQVKLNDLLRSAGAIVVDKPYVEYVTILEDGTEKIEKHDVNIDLSLEAISKETIIELLS